MSDTPELVTADRAAIIRDDWLISDDPDTDCIPGLCASIIALHEALAAANARADAAEARVAVRVKPLETAESRELQQSASIPHLPTQLTYECQLAISGEGPRACDWTDKPHRLVYDLCREIERIAALETGAAND